MLCMQVSELSPHVRYLQNQKELLINRALFSDPRVEVVLWFLRFSVYRQAQSRRQNGQSLQEDSDYTKVVSKLSI